MGIRGMGGGLDRYGSWALLWELHFLSLAKAWVAQQPQPRYLR